VHETPIKIDHHIVIGEAHGPETESSDHSCIACCVSLSVMRIAVDLDNNTARGAEKVDDPPADDSLPPEFEPLEAAAAQCHPEAFFGFGRIIAHFSGAASQRLCRDATTPNPLL
jgi:hypothetical protein